MLVLYVKVKCVVLCVVAMCVRYDACALRAIAENSATLCFVVCILNLCGVLF